MAKMNYHYVFCGVMIRYADFNTTGGIQTLNDIIININKNRSKKLELIDTINSEFFLIGEIIAESNPFTPFEFIDLSYYENRTTKAQKAKDFTELLGMNFTQLDIKTFVFTEVK